MTDMQKRILSLILLVVFVISCVAVNAADTAKTTTIVDLDKATPSSTANGIVVTDLERVLEAKGAPVFADLPVKPKLHLLKLKANESYATLTEPLAIFVVDGTATIKTENLSEQVNSMDGVYIPAGFAFSVENNGGMELQYYSFAEPAEGQPYTTDNAPENITIMKNQENREYSFENKSDHIFYIVKRMVNPNEHSLPISFDVVLVNVKAGAAVDPYIVNGTANLFITLSGSGTTDCGNQEFEEGDAIFVNKDGAISVKADTAVTFLAVAYPYYQYDNEYKIDLCTESEKEE